MIHTFLSYRRTDTADATGRLHDNLRVKFGKELVFRDVYSLVYGVNWREHIDDALKSTDVVLAIIGTGWLTATDPMGRRRLDDPEDSVRRELERARELNVPILPVLVDSATMPRLEDLPESLKPLYYLNAAPLRDTDFEYDFERLVKAIQKYARQNEPESIEKSKSADETKRSGDVVAAPGDTGQAILKPTTKPPSRNLAVSLKVCIGLIVISVIAFLTLHQRPVEPPRDLPSRADSGSALRKCQVVIGEYADMNEARQKQISATKLGFRDSEIYGQPPQLHMRFVFSTKEEAESAAQKLKAAGISHDPQVLSYRGK